MKHFRFLFLSVLAVFLMSVQANAIVLEWDYTISGEFTSSVIGGVASGPISTDRLSWGTGPSGSSSLVLEPDEVTSSVDTYVGGGVPTSDFWADSIALTHNNNPLDYNSSTLTQAVLTLTVTLDPVVPNDPALPASSFDFNISFEETPNSGDDPRDIFLLVGGFPNLGFTYDDGSGAVDYFINVFPKDGSILSQIGDDLGFLTPENDSTLLPFAFTISTEALAAIPEPSTMMLFGIGLLGMARLSRKKK